MDGPERVVDVWGMAERMPLGEDCKLLGVSLRRNGGELLTSS
jgi:hypothetical protein